MSFKVLPVPLPSRISSMALVPWHHH